MRRVRICNRYPCRTCSGTRPNAIWEYARSTLGYPCTWAHRKWRWRILGNKPRKLYRQRPHRQYRRQSPWCSRGTHLPTESEPMTGPRDEDKKQCWKRYQGRIQWSQWVNGWRSRRRHGGRYLNPSYPIKLKWQHTPHSLMDPLLILLQCENPCHIECSLIQHVRGDHDRGSLISFSIRMA